MAKQTFTTGQVLTAAQMTSLQQTAMGGGSATAKTASYVLVAADAGTTVAMNAAGATTITVNTGLFAAGDTVFIQNLGAGACTVTAGTATVATAGSLILPQNDAGILYFTATGASIFYDFIQAGAVSPLTTKGDLYTFSTSDARLGVGANATVLTADSAEATGLKWVAPAGASTLNLSQVATGSLSGVTLSLTGLSSYDTILVMISGVTNSTDNTTYNFRTNTTTGVDAAATGAGTHIMTTYSNTQIFAFGDYALDFGDGKIYPQKVQAYNNASNLISCLFTNCKAAGFTTFRGTANYQSDMNDSSNIRNVYSEVDGIIRNAAAVSSIQFTNGNAYTMNAGSYYVFAG